MHEFKAANLTSLPLVQIDFSTVFDNFCHEKVRKNPSTLLERALWQLVKLRSLKAI